MSFLSKKIHIVISFQERMERRRGTQNCRADNTNFSRFQIRKLNLQSHILIVFALLSLFVV